MSTLFILLTSFSKESVTVRQDSVLEPRKFKASKYHRVGTYTSSAPAPVCLEA